LFSRSEISVRRGSRLEFLKAATGVILFAGVVRVAEAHAKLVRSTPKDGASLRSAPKEIEFWFNELLDDQFNTVHLFAAKELADKDRKDLVHEKPQVDQKDRTHLTLKVPPLEPGSYAVEYRVLSRDGHSAPGRITFILQPKS
jgi:methionine-rich copper-binding protein CopC